MFVSKKRPKIDVTLIDNIVHAHLDYVKNTGIELTCSEISELLRYSLCNALSLPTKGYSERIETIGVGCIGTLSHVLSAYDFANKPLDIRQGLLEACVYSIESARNRVLGVGKYE